MLTREIKAFYPGGYEGKVRLEEWRRWFNLRPDEATRGKRSFIG
jgi:hypothetical protein